MVKSLVLALTAGVAMLGAGAADAANVSWSVGINTPVVGTVISNAPAYGYGYGYGPARVYAPVPVYVAPPVAYYPAPGVYYRPAPVYYGRHYHPGWRHDGRRWDGRGWR